MESEEPREDFNEVQNSFNEVQKLMREVIEEEKLEEVEDKFKAQIVHEVRQDIMPQMKILVQMIMERIDLVNNRIDLIHQRVNSFDKEMEALDNVMNTIMEWMTLQQKKSESDQKNGLN